MSSQNPNLIRPDIDGIMDPSSATADLPVEYNNRARMSEIRDTTKLTIYYSTRGVPALPSTGGNFRHRGPPRLPPLHLRLRTSALLSHCHLHRGPGHLRMGKSWAQLTYYWCQTSCSDLCISAVTISECFFMLSSK